MRKVWLIVILITLGTGFCSGQDKNTKDINYEIEIINYYFGKVNHTTMVTNESIISNNYLLVGEPVKTEHQLVKHEKRKLINFLMNFPLSKLEKEYIYDGVEDGTQLRFIINLNGIKKDIYVANAYQKDLGDLVALLVPMLAEDYIGYTKELVPWEVKE